ALTLPPAGQFAFDWRDQLGLTNSSPWRLLVQSVKDGAPSPMFADLPREVALLETESLELKVAARDDFGVKELGVHWETMADGTSSNAPAKTEFKLEAANPREKKLEETFSFSPELLKIPPDTTVEIHAYATDFFPGREPSETVAYRVQVVGNERHAELVRQKLETLLAQLEEVTRQEDKLAAATREALTLPKEKFTGQEAADRAAKLTQDQFQTARQMEQLAEEGLKTLQEAARNPTFKDEKLREWAKNMQEMQNIGSQKMKQAANSLKSAQQQSSDREKKLGEALDKEQEILDQLEKLQKNVNGGLDDLQAMTLAQRLRKVGGDETGIQEQLQKIVPETIGLTPKEVPERFQKAQASLAAEQGNTHTESETLQAELGRFFERTRRANYGQVSEEMKKTRANEELERVKGLISENITMEAMQNLTAWARRFDEWADLLEPKEKPGQKSNQQGQGNGSQGEQMLNQLMAFLRMREGQVNVRERTRQLEKQKAATPDYKGSARALAAAQQRLLFSMRDAQEENPTAELGGLMQKGFESMSKAESLLSQPRTDDVTRQTHTQSIETLTDLINILNEQAQRNKSQSGQQSATAEEMAFMMQMMSQQQGTNPGMSPGSSPGMNTAGGSTDRAGQAPTGDVAGRANESRSVSRATGVSGAVPSEFREALENYFNALEKQKN
ncbi:MAG TPA: hypothetical protein VHH73_06690, partial [Verrucomicrobiae bacterium]|nr:hypothetical protein [Verrucomicrobiae bacterium]